MRIWIRKLKFHNFKNETVIRNILFCIILYFQVFRNLQCLIFENLKMIYVLPEKFHQSKVSGYQNHTVSSSPILDVITLVMWGKTFWNPSIAKTVDWDRKPRDMWSEILNSQYFYVKFSILFINSAISIKIWSFEICNYF